MKIRSAILAIVVTCAALLIMASRTEAVSPSAAQKVGVALVPSPTATLLPKLPPDVFTMNGSVTFHAPDNVFSIKIPKSWQQMPVVNGYYFYVGNMGLSTVALDIQYIDVDQYAEELGITTPVSSPQELLEQVKKQADFSPTNTSASSIYVARMGNLTGYGITLTMKTPFAQTTDLRIAKLTDKKMIVILYESLPQYWPQAKPVLDRILTTLVVKPQNIPTSTLVPTPTAVPPLVFTPSAQSDVKQSVDADGSPLLGDSNTPITLLEYVDFACIHCGEYQPVIRQVIDKYVRSGEVKIVVRFVRFVGDKYSELSASAAICAAKQGHFLDMEEALFAVEQQQSYESYTPETIQSIATQLKMDTDKMTVCLQDPATLATFEKDVDSATDLGIQGVPSVLYAIDGKNFTGIPDSTGQFTMQPSFDDIAHAIEAAFDPGKSEM